MGSTRKHRKGSASPSPSFDCATDYKWFFFNFASLGNFRNDDARRGFYFPPSLIRFNCTPENIVARVGIITYRCTVDGPSPVATVPRVLYVVDGNNDVEDNNNIASSVRTRARSSTPPCFRVRVAPTPLVKPYHAGDGGGAGGGGSRHGDRCNAEGREKHVTRSGPRERGEESIC